MGDRANIVVESPDGSWVWLYSHWGGDGLRPILKTALTRGKSRWDDENYLARIIFSEMILNDIGGLTGFGISAHMVDNEHPILVCDTLNQTVRLISDERGQQVIAKVSMDEFIQMSEPELLAWGEHQRAVS